MSTITSNHILKSIQILNTLAPYLSLTSSGMSEITQNLVKLKKFFESKVENENQRFICQNYQKCLLLLQFTKLIQNDYLTNDLFYFKRLQIVVNDITLVINHLNYLIL